MTGGMKLGARVRWLEWPGTGEEEGARGAKGTVAGGNSCWRYQEGMEKLKEQLSAGVRM